jgi:hypothetical protein
LLITVRIEAREFTIWQPCIVGPRGVGRISG